MDVSYWYYGLICLSVLLTAYVLIEETHMGSPSDLAKLVENMKRANTITDRAADDADKHAAIMDSFEKRLNLNHENMSKIEEYDKMMAAMDTSNGGPALDATFPSTSEDQPTGTVSNSTIGFGKHGS